jgi:hypothetical protein
MFCPRCGTNQSEELKFCKSCGTNLLAVRQVANTRDTGEKFDWSKTWLTEMFLSEGERKRRKEELERQRGITPEVKRHNEIKAGVITASVGIAVSIFLSFFMEGIIRGGKVPPAAAEIISRIWIVGVIPFFIGLALVINGLFVRSFTGRSAGTDRLDKGTEQKTLGSDEISDFIPTSFSVTEGTTKHLERPKQDQ